MMMTFWWEGPALRDRARSACFANTAFGHVLYQYVDEHGKRAPAYEATHIRLRAFNLSFGAPLEPLEDALRTLPGFQSAQQIRDHADLRPQVVAIFQRRVSEPVG